uniref:Uncharacterized protein n=1 Tax=Dicentrarchus labrax TaxID=13489 RepID=A0A8P4KFG4_DICLA
MCVKAPALLKMIDTFDRPGKAFAAGAYSGSGSFEPEIENKPGKRIPKKGVYAAAGLGYARAEYSIFDAQAKGPNAGVGFGASAASGVKAIVKAEMASASVTAGPVRAKVGLAADTGFSAGWSGVEVKVLGTGVSIGPTMKISLFGSSLELNFL